METLRCNGGGVLKLRWGTISCPEGIASLVEKWVHFFGPVNGKTKVDSFIGYAAHLGLIRGGTPSGLYC